MLKIQNYIGGQFLECDQYMDSYDPSTGLAHALVPDSGKKEVDLAVEAAKKAFQR